MADDGAADSEGPWYRDPELVGGSVGGVDTVGAFEFIFNVRARLPHQTGE